MSRFVTVAAAQLGPIQMAEPRSSAVGRMVALLELERAHRRGVELVVFPELALTTFFPRHYHEDISHADAWFETAMPSDETAPIFDAARRYGIGFHLGYAEMAREADAAGAVRSRRFEAHHLRVFHSHLSVQAGCYQNACFAVATAKAGIEDGNELFGHSIIVNPQGEINRHGGKLGR